MTGGPEIEFESDVEFDRLPLVLENSVYRMAQEALTNACRHSRSEKVAMVLRQEGNRICLEVRDWGVGFDPASVDRDCFGLEGIRERARMLGGEAAIESRPRSGTTVRVVVPLGESNLTG